MVFREKTYSVLIVSSGSKFTQSAMSLLPSTDYWPVNTVSSAAEARRAVLENEYDIILINTPLEGEYGTNLAVDIAADSCASVLLFVKSEVYDEVYSKVVENGVMLISKPTSSMMITQTLHLMCAARERMRSMEKKQTSVEEKISEIRLINKAKWLLIENLRMSEADAHHYLEKQAMDMRISKKQAAENIIRTYS